MKKKSERNNKTKYTLFVYTDTKFVSGKKANQLNQSDYIVGWYPIDRSNFIRLEILRLI